MNTALLIALAVLLCIVVGTSTALIIRAINRACSDVLTRINGAVEEMREDKFESLCDTMGVQQ